MFDYSMAEIGNIVVMQAFSGLSLFSVLLLMALGLAIIFGQMGVINMAHGEFMAIGAYTTVFLSKVAETYGIVNYYFLFAIVAAFIIAFIIGYLVEFALIRHLYKRPLDTLLATWGLSLVMQQIFRSTFGAKEVSAVLPEWLMGSFQLHRISISRSTASSCWCWPLWSRWVCSSLCSAHAGVCVCVPRCKTA